MNRTTLPLLVATLCLLVAAGCSNGSSHQDNQNDNAADGGSNANNNNATTGDADNDGVPDDVDNCPERQNNDQADLDGDGIGDVCDSDVDGDTVPNDLDNCPGISNVDQVDADGDGDGDPCDIDDDGDGINDVQDNCQYTVNPDQADADGDGIGDACEDDIDGDGVADVDDNCVDIPNPNQENLDGDAFGDVCDDDKDGDGYPFDQDCDDFDPILNPGAPEVCNGADDNCDQIIDFPDDAYEPNDVPADAYDIGSISDCGGTLTVTNARLSQLGDEDWFVFHDSDDTFCYIYPEAQFTSNPGGHRICIYFFCDDGAPLPGSSGCDIGTWVTDGPSFAPYGCCDPSHVKLDHDCSNADDSADLYVKVTRSATSCDSYSFNAFDE
ncbi:MAG: thrombospondin type 3 repeat-containing protein [bacterium]